MLAFGKSEKRADAELQILQLVFTIELHQIRWRNLISHAEFNIFIYRVDQHVSNLKIYDVHLDKTKAPGEAARGAKLTPSYGPHASLLHPHVLLK